MVEKLSLRKFEDFLEAFGKSIEQVFGNSTFHQKKNYLMASRRKIMNEFLLKIPGFLHQENSTIQEDKECTTKQLQQWEAQNEEHNAEVRQQNSKTSTESAWSNFFSLTMASEKNEGTGTIHWKALHHQNFIICRFSTIFLRHPEKTSSFIEKEEKLFLGGQSLLDTRFDTELQLTGSQPLWPQFNGQRFMEHKIQYQSQSLIDTQTKHFTSNHLLNFNLIFDFTNAKPWRRRTTSSKTKAALLVSLLWSSSGLSKKRICSATFQPWPESILRTWTCYLPHPHRTCQPTTYSPFHPSATRRQRNLPLSASRYHCSSLPHWSVQRWISSLHCSHLSQGTSFSL